MSTSEKSYSQSGTHLSSSWLLEEIAIVSLIYGTPKIHKIHFCLVRTLCKAYSLSSNFATSVSIVRIKTPKLRDQMRTIIFLRSSGIILETDFSLAPMTISLECGTWRASFKAFSRLKTHWFSLAGINLTRLLPLEVTRQTCLSGTPIQSKKSQFINSISLDR